MPSPHPSTQDEVVAVFDSNGRVCGTAKRSRVYAEGLWHSSAGVLVRSTDGDRIYVHRRSATKAVFAGHHDCLAGGVVDPGESPEQTARRELAEELGVEGVSLRPLAKVSWDGQWNARPLRCHLHAYETRYDGPFEHQRSEIADGWWWSRAELLAHLADPEWLFVPDTRVLLADFLT